MRQDFRRALRTLLRSPAYSLTAVLTLALAVGANTTVFGLLDALVLRPLPVPHPEQLLVLTASDPGSSYGAGLTFPMFETVRRSQSVFASVIGWTQLGSANVATETDETHEAVALVSGDFCSELGAHLLRGRPLAESDVNEATARPAMVAVISESFWRREYAMRDDAIGRTVRLEGYPFTIVGVVGQDFKGLGLAVEPGIFAPLTVEPLLDDTPMSSVWVHTAGRLRAGVTATQARAAMVTSWERLKAASVPATYSGAQRERFMARTLNVVSGEHGVDALQDRFAQPLLIVCALTAIMLLIAALNLASLALARATVRADDQIVRRALGAGRIAALRPILCENLWLAAVGTAVGAGVGMLGSVLLARVLLGDYTVRASLDIALDIRLITYVVLVAVVSAAVCSLGPAWLSGRTQARSLSRIDSRTVARAGMTGYVLVGSQICLSVVLVVTSGLLLRGLAAIRSVPSGMDSARVFVAYPRPRPNGYATVNNDRYYPDVLDRLSALPGVERVAAALGKPAGGAGAPARIRRRSDPEAQPGYEADSIAVSPGFFDVTGIRRIAGRDFDWSDSSKGRRVAIVSEALAARLGPSPIGTHVRIGGAPVDPDVEIVGIVADAHLYDLRAANVAAVYVPALQQSNSSWKCFVIRGALPPIPDLNAVLNRFGYELVANVESLDYITDRTLLTQRLLAMLGGAVGGLALLVACIGQFGLMRYVVAGRRREIGIRIALGADRQRVMQRILIGALALSGSGALVGIGLAWITASWLTSVLVGVGVHDVLTFGVAPMLLILCAIVSSWGPAWSAGSTDPLIAMRSE